MNKSTGRRAASKAAVIIAVGLTIAVCYPPVATAVTDFLSHGLTSKTKWLRSLTETGPVVFAAANPQASDEAGESSKPKVKLADGDAKSIVAKACANCHSLANITSSRKTEDEWRDTVEVMISRGADVSADDVDPITRYLAKNYGPATASKSGKLVGSVTSAVDTQLPEGDAKHIFASACTACHSITNIRNAHKTEDEWRGTVDTMIGRGANVQPSEIDLVVEYLAKNFGASKAK